MCFIENSEDNQNQKGKSDDSFKLNPMAKEFVPSPSNTRKKKNLRTSKAFREDAIKRTVYVSDIHHQITEQQLALHFLPCGNIVDCRISRNPKSGLHFAFVEFSEEESAISALNLSGTMLYSYSYCPIRVAPSKTGIVPVNPALLPKCEDEYEMCIRTIYCTNIDKNIGKEKVRSLFESRCGEVRRLRVVELDDNRSSCIGFVEFKEAKSATAALKLSGSVLGSLPIRVSPSKTPLRPLIPLPPIS